MKARTKLNGLEVLISKTLIDSNISHDEFSLINNVLEEYGDMNKKLVTWKRYTLMKNVNILLKILYYCLKCKKSESKKTPRVVKTKKWKNYDFIKLCGFQ